MMTAAARARASPTVRTRLPRSASACHVAHLFHCSRVTGGAGKSKGKRKRERSDSFEGSDSEEHDERYQKLNVRDRRRPRTGTPPRARRF